MVAITRTQRNKSRLALAFAIATVVFISFIFIYLGTVAPSVHDNCFSGGRGTNVFRL